VPLTYNRNDGAGTLSRLPPDRGKPGGHVKPRKEGGCSSGVLPLPAKPAPLPSAMAYHLRKYSPTPEHEEGHTRRRNWAAGTTWEIDYTPTNSSELNRHRGPVSPRCATSPWNGTDHPSKGAGQHDRPHIIWRNNHRQPDPSLRKRLSPGKRRLMRCSLTWHAEQRNVIASVESQYIHRRGLCRRTARSSAKPTS